MYIKYLQQTPAEVESLFRDLLTSATHFFRDSGAFKVLEEQVIARIFADKPVGATIRIWSTGCSTGEEAYSLAILLKERLETLKKNYKVQIFATDIDSRAIATARAGLYPAGIAADITTQRLARFFTAEAGSGNYRIHKKIRDMLVFSQHNIIKDPPFSKLDLISCRNLLTDRGVDLHKKLLPLFHYTLNPGGFLFLGTSETVGDFGELFTTLDRKANLYQRREVLHGTQRTALDRLLPPLVLVDALHPWKSGKKDGTGKLSFRELTEQTLLQQVAPTGALVTRNGDILYLHGRTGMYLEPPPGVTGVNNILSMAREGLQRDLTTSLHQAVKEKKIVRCQGLNVETNGDFTQVNLTVRPVLTGPGATAEAPLYLVILEEVPPLVAASCGCPSTSDEVDCLRSTVHIASLRRELQAKAEYLQAANEELETANEEMQSVNEELQSTNEELETAKEETQSINEELSTVNAELQTKVSDLSRANNDKNNLLAGTGIATVFVDHQLRILRYTPAATGIINLIMSDIGRPVAHIVSKLVGYNNLPADARAVMDTLVPKEIEAETTEGKWYTLRIHPYRTVDNVIEGAVITFVDITEMKKTQEALLKANKLLRLAVVVRDAHDAVTVQDLDGRILAWNPGAVRMYGWSEAEALTMNVRSLIPKELREEALARVQQLSLAEILKPYCTQRIAKDGTVMDVSMVSTALINEADHIYAITTTERMKGHNIVHKQKILQ
jgi:two-component system CheB/CheR fusion protein